jgi:hypothetical protein
MSESTGNVSDLLNGTLLTYNTKGTAIMRVSKDLYDKKNKALAAAERECFHTLAVWGG